MIFRIVAIVACSYLGLALLVYLRQSGMVYFPVGPWACTPDDMGLTYENVTLTTADNVKLSAWFVAVDEPKAVVLLCHGNGGNISHRVDLLWKLNRLGVSTLIFDYRGYGRSEGKPGEAGTYADGEAAWDYLVNVRGVAPESIVIFGRSLGGAVAAKLASQHACRGLILESVFTRLPDVAASYFWYLPVRLLCRFRYPTVDYVQKVSCPILVIHSPADDIIPHTFGRRVFDAAPEPKTFLEISGDHNTGYETSGRTYTDGLAAFLSEAGENSSHRQR